MAAGRSGRCPDPTAWLFALLLARRGRRAAAAEARAVQLEWDNEQRAQDAAVTERGRIARELHDVIAHSVGVMTVLAGAARMQLPDHPDRAVPPCWPWKRPADRR